MMSFIWDLLKASQLMFQHLPTPLHLLNQLLSHSCTPPFNRPQLFSRPHTPPFSRPQLLSRSHTPPFSRPQLTQQHSHSTPLTLDPDLPSPSTSTQYSPPSEVGLSQSDGSVLAPLDQLLATFVGTLSAKQVSALYNFSGYDSKRSMAQRWEQFWK